MIEATLEKWHRMLAGDPAVMLDDLLHEDVVFYSPIVFTPQRGREITKLYLRAAGNTLDGDGGAGTPGTGEAKPKSKGKFRYVREVVAGNHAVLEFETEADGKYVNGIDMITCDDDGKIVDFKVMIRPLQAINTVHRQMAAMLEKLAPA